MSEIFVTLLFLYYHIKSQCKYHTCKQAAFRWNSPTLLSILFITEQKFVFDTGGMIQYIDIDINITHNNTLHISHISLKFRKHIIKIKKACRFEKITAIGTNVFFYTYI